MTAERAPVLRGPLTHPAPGYTVLIFDCDGTLRRCTVPGQPCPNAPDEWGLLPNVRATLARYGWWTTHRFLIVSNQGGVGLGYVSEAMAIRLLWDCARACVGTEDRTLSAAGVFLCPHAPTADCHCRKPSPYLLWCALDAVHPSGRRFHRREALYVGDMDSDRDAAARAGMAFCAAADFFGWEDPVDA